MQDKNKDIQLTIRMSTITDITLSVVALMGTYGTSTIPSCSGPIPAQKLRGNSVPGVVFSQTMPKMDFRYSHRFS